MSNRRVASCRHRISASHQGRNVHCAEVSDELSQQNGRNYYHSHIPILQLHDTCDESVTRPRAIVNCAHHSEYLRCPVKASTSSYLPPKTNRSTKVNTACDAISENTLRTYSTKIINDDTNSLMFKADNHSCVCSGQLKSTVSSPDKESHLQSLQQERVDVELDSSRVLPLQSFQTFMKHTKDTLNELTDSPNVQWEKLDYTLRQATEGVVQLAKEWKKTGLTSDGMLTISPIEVTDVDVTPTKCSDSELTQTQRVFLGKSKTDSWLNSTETPEQNPQRPYVTFSSANTSDKNVVVCHTPLRDKPISILKRSPDTRRRHVVLVKSDLQSWLIGKESIALTKSHCVKPDLDKHEKVDLSDILQSKDNNTTHESKEKMSDELCSNYLEQPLSNVVHNESKREQMTIADTTDIERNQLTEQLDIHRLISPDRVESKELVYLQTNRIKSLEAVLEAERSSAHSLSKELDFEQRCCTELLVEHQRAIERSLQDARRELAYKTVMRYHEQELYWLNVLVLTMFASGCLMAFCLVLF